MTKISIFGMGYVGAVSAGCLAHDGHTVIGVDPNRTKIDLINNGQSPIVEQGLDTLIAEAIPNGRLSAISDAAIAIHSTDISLVCVGTPSESSGRLNLSYVQRVCQEIGVALRDHPAFHVVVLRSTMLPGSMREIVIPTLEEFSGKRAGIDFGVCNNPEFLREGTAIHDFFNPPKTIIGTTDDRSFETVAKLYKNIEAPLIRTSVDVAEMVKYSDNVWHALKVGFANEIGNICKAVNIDSHTVMDIFCHDTKLNLSSYYLKPGFAFGGSCLPKDVRALTYKARALDLNLPILNAIMPSNEVQINRGIDRIIAKGHKKIGILGLSFKAGTDDLRESPIVEVVERLIGKGYELKIYDGNVNLAALTGSNRDYLLNHIPHISRLMTKTIDEVLEHAHTIVIGNRGHEFFDLPQRIRPDQALIDLVRIPGDQHHRENYDGICW